MGVLVPVGQCGALATLSPRTARLYFYGHSRNCQVFIYLLVCLIFQFLFLQIPSQISVPRPNRGFGVMLQRRLWVDCAWYIELMDSQSGLIILSIMLRFIFIYVLQKGHV